jgi:hypothetical protein
MIFHKKVTTKTSSTLLQQLTCSDTFLSLAVVGLLVLMVVPMSAGLGVLMLAIYNSG